MSGVGSTNAMKKGSGNNPFLAYSEVDMQNYLNSAYVGCIVKYTGPSTRTPVPRGHRLSLGDAQNLVVDLTKKFTYSNTSYKPRRWDIGIESENTVNRIQDIEVDSKTGIIGSGRNDIKALICSNYNSVYGKNINDISVKFLAVSNEYVDRKVIVNWPVTYGNNGWQSDCFNDSGKITLWGYEETVTAYQDENNIDYWDNSVVIYTEPYAINKLYKVAYGNGRYYFEEFYYISENITTGTVEDVAPGKTFYDFTGTKQTGTGTKINPYLATDIATFKSYPIGSFIKWLGPDRTVLDETTGQMLIQNEIYRAVEDGDVFQYAILPTLSNPADPIDVAEGKEVINQLGAVMIGTGNNILQASTTAGMQALFIDANIGKIAKYVGETDVYIKDAFYLITSDANAKQYYELPVLTNEGTAADLALGKELINSKGIKIVGTKLSIGSFDKTSWSDIRNIVLSGKASDYWKVGDTKTITSKSGKIYNIRLTDLQTNRYTYSDGSGSSKAVFEFVECYLLNNESLWESLWPMNGIVTNGGGWASSEMRSQTMPIILADLPDDMVEVMSQVKVLSGTGDGSTSGTSSSDNKLFLPAEIEMFNRAIYSIGLEESPLGQFDYYKANDINFARIKRTTGDSMTVGYWLRSPRKDNFGDFMCININGAIQTRESDNATCISPIFAI